jgi:nitric oxide dioxygenase
MSPQQKELIKATIPILRESGESLTNYFYARMLNAHPELKNIFNMGNQANGKQKSALANAVLAYAENIDYPGVLLSVLKGIGNKHRSLHVQPGHYKIVGEHLIASIGEVVGEAATPEILDAWTVAYYQLAEIMINLEKGLYHENAAKAGSWNGWRNFIIKKIVQESTEIKSFYLYPEDKKEIADFHAGQFISVKVFVPELDHFQPRQYSLSSSSNGEYYRISVKKEIGIVPNPSGMVSQTLHTRKEGDIISISAPAGLFHLEKDSQSPLVLISGGVGLTPMLSMLETNVNSIQNKKTIWIHGCRNESVHAFKNQIIEIKKEAQHLETFTFYDKIENHDQTSNHVIQGRVNLHKCKDAILLEEAKYYICGPEMFIKTQYDALISLNVNQENIFYEEFGPQLINLN